MVKKVKLMLIVGLVNFNIFSQTTEKEIDTWEAHYGISNFIMQGDMHSFKTDSGKNYFNFGGYAGVSKMFNPILGLEFRAKFSKISGASQELFEGYNLKYVNANYDRKNLMFKGFSYGGELNLVINLTNTHRKLISKYTLTSYLGIGYHFYNSSLYSIEDGIFEQILDTDFDSHSIYLSGQLGVRRRINKRFDIEFRTGIFLNYEDHLDAAISDKQNWENFIVSSIGLVVRLGKEKI